MTSKKREIRKQLTRAELANFHMDSETAEALAEPFRMTDSDPIDDPLNVAPSLLSADHIIEYVNQTGMVAPFESVKGEKSRLKAASYEGRIGKNAYVFEKGNSNPQPALEEGAKTLRVRANSIVFVESDLDFRLPPFIAVRFNLQINHVHRGLLLGTGPLVDPGFWGKLCIPLHNLTNEDYEIPLNEGLFWVEFTRTTSVPFAGRPPSNSGFWDIRRFITKAAQPADLNQPPVPILSSIPDMVDQTEANSEKASLDAQTAAREASEAKDAVTRSESFIRRFGFSAGIAGFLGILALWGSYYSDMNEHFETVRPMISELRNDVDRHIGQIDRSIDPRSEAPVIISDLDQTVEDQSKAIGTLRSEIEKLKPCLHDRNRPGQACNK